MKFLLPVYLTAFVAANLIVKHFGAYGLWFSSFLLIPFDFIARCVIHEKYAGVKLFFILFSLTVLAGAATILINFSAMNIALASIAGFSSVQIAAGLFYQTFKKRSYLFKVNLSDLVAIIVDSIVFQFVAFDSLNINVTAGQIMIKMAGGLLWYFILFKKLKLNEKINRK